MVRWSKFRERALALFILGVLIMNYPMMALFSVDGFVFGIPLLYAYVFSAWLLLIVLAALLVARIPKPPHERARAQTAKVRA
jgi:hypothetical protein